MMNLQNPSVEVDCKHTFGSADICTQCDIKRSASNVSCNHKFITMELRNPPSSLGSHRCRCEYCNINYFYYSVLCVEPIIRAGLDADDMHICVWDSDEEKKCVAKRGQCPYHTPDPSGTTYHVSIQTNRLVEIVGSRGVSDIKGRRMGDYGCGHHPQVSIYCHIRNTEGKLISKYYFDEQLPAKLFVGKKEGDVIEVVMNDDRKINLVLDQIHTDTIDCEFEGRFKYIIKGEIYSYTKKRHPDQYTPPLSFDEQNIMFQEFANLL